MRFAKRKSRTVHLEGDCTRCSTRQEWDVPSLDVASWDRLSKGKGGYRTTWEWDCAKCGTTNSKDVTL